MRNIIGASLAFGALVAGLLLIYQQTASTKTHVTNPAQPVAGSVAPFELMKSNRKALPAETWPAF